MARLFFSWLGSFFIIIFLTSNAVPFQPLEDRPESSPLYLPVISRNYTAPSVLRVGESGQYRTIQAAIHAATPPASYKIEVSGGTYFETITITRPITVSIQGGWNSNFTSFSSDANFTVVDAEKRNSVFSIMAAPGVPIRVTLDGITIQNGVSDQGAGIYAVSSGPNSILALTVKNSILRSNSTTFQEPFDGGGLSVDARGSGAVAEITLLNNLITGNQARSGGGMIINSADGGYTNCIIRTNSVSNNFATDFGGGIWINSVRGGSETVVAITQNDIISNVVPNLDGGGIAAYVSDSFATTTLLVEGNLILNNKAGFGAGFFSYGGGEGTAINATLRNNVIAANEAHTMAGGVFLTGNTTMQNNTIAYNHAYGHPAGGLHINSNTMDNLVSLSNDILWGNEGDSGDNDLDLYLDLPYAVVVKASYLIIGAITNYEADFTCLACENSDPLFVSPVDFLYELQDGSPGIDKGDPHVLFSDGCLPPGKGTMRADQGAYGGPSNCLWFPVNRPPDHPGLPFKRIHE